MGIIIKNKARLVVQGYNQQEDMDYDKTFALVARLEAIRIFLALLLHELHCLSNGCQKCISHGKLKKKFMSKTIGFESNELPTMYANWPKPFTDLIKSQEHGISINQEKYVKDLLKKYDINGSSVKIPMVPPNKLGPDLSGTAVPKRKTPPVLIQLQRGKLGVLLSKSSNL
ncbi:retrovirus-related pol polyprotein from transposon TNT 1-94 [Tanacetum coccineum]